MKITKNVAVLTAVSVAVLGVYALHKTHKKDIKEINAEVSTNVVQTVKAEETATRDVDSPREVVEVRYTSMGVPSISSYKKTWMDYRKITAQTSPQYKFVRKWGWVDSNGFMRCDGEQELGITDDYYLIALGSYYGTTIGAKYKITTDTGRIFYGTLAEQKADRHTNSTNQYVPHNGNIVEFLVNTDLLNESVKRMGSANVYMPLNGNIKTIEKIDFIRK